MKEEEKKKPMGTEPQQPEQEEPEEEVTEEEEQEQEPQQEQEPETAKEAVLNTVKSFGKKRKKRRKKNYLLRVGIIVAIIVAAVLLMHINHFDVIGVAVGGNHELTSEEVIELSGIEIGKSVFDVHPFLVERRLEKNLYIEEAQVNRKLPNAIEIIITEKQPAAQFKNKKKYIVIDSDGKVMNISKSRKDVTLVKGIHVEKARTGKLIQVKETDKYDKVMKLIAITAENDLYFKRIKLKDGWIEARVYKKIYVKGKYNNVIKSIQSKELVAVVYDLYQKGISKGTINVGSNNYCSFTKKI